jgi:Domain of unknown function (DUF4185)
LAIAYWLYLIREMLFDYTLLGGGILSFSRSDSTSNPLNHDGTDWLYSGDLGQTWHERQVPFGSRSSNFNMLALTIAAVPDNPDGKYVYALGTPCGRFGAAKLGRVLKDHVLEVGAWEYFTRVNGDSEGAPNWEKNCDNAAEVVPAPVGEASVLWKSLHKPVDIHVFEREYRQYSIA